MTKILIDEAVVSGALKDLEVAQSAIGEWGSYASAYFQEKHGLADDIEALTISITALRQALEQTIAEAEQPAHHTEQHLEMVEQADKFCDANCVWSDHHPDCVRAEQPAQQEPVAHVLFRQDDDGLEPIMFYPKTTAPDPKTLKDRFVLMDVWLSPHKTIPPAPAQPLTDNRMKVKLGSQYGADLEGHWFYLQPADEFAEAALVQRTGITKGN